MTSQENYKIPIILKGQEFTDERGTLFFNMKLDLNEVKRMYFIENLNTDIIRGWQGHLIEKRWFTCVKGKILICVKEIDNFQNSNINQFILDENSFETLYIPNGFAFTIQSLISDTKLMVMSDFYYNQTNDLVTSFLNK